jgi:iron(III) transport system permease protein
VLRLAAAAAVALLTLLPLLFVVGSTIAMGWAEASRLIFRSRVAELLLNTVELLAAGMLASAALGTAAAWLVVRTSLPGRRIWDALLAAPLAVPAFVNSYAWVSLTPSVEGLAGAVLITTLSYFPLVYLPVVAVLRGLDPALEESARTLGLGPWGAFRRAVLPQLRPAIAGGALLVGLHLLAEFGALQMLRFPTFTTAIYDQFQSTFNGSAATMLAGVLVTCCLLLLALEVGLIGRRRYARVGSGAARRTVTKPRGRLTPLTVLAMAVLVGLALGVPLASLGHWLGVGSSTEFPLGSLVSATLSTLVLGFAAAALTSVLAFPVAWLSVRHRGLVSRAIERSTYIGNSLPGIVVALALITLSIRFLPATYQSTGLLLAAYAILFMPLSMVSIRAALAQIPPELDDVARSLGARPAAVLYRVTLPLVARGLGAGAALVFLAVVTELTATLLLAPIGTDTLATGFWGNAASLAYGAAAPYAVLMVLISAPAAYLLTRQSRRMVAA